MGSPAARPDRVKRTANTLLEDGIMAKSPETADFARPVLDAVPCPVFVADEDARVLYANRAGCEMVETSDVVNRPLCGDLLRCVHARESKKICGTTEFCPDCAVRNAIMSAYKGFPVTRQRTKMELEGPDGVQEVHFLVTTSPLEIQGKTSVLLVLEDVTELVELRGLLPICSNCKKIRNDQHYWEQVESFLSQRTALRFTHSLCPDCLEKLYPG